MAYQAVGEAIRIAMPTNFTKSLERRWTTLPTDAPKTLRMPISLMRRSVLKVAKPYKPIQEIKIARRENARINEAALRSARYRASNSSLANWYSKGISGISCFQMLAAASKASPCLPGTVFTKNVAAYVGSFLI